MTESQASAGIPPAVQGESVTNDADERRELGARLREAREFLGLLQEEVATALGIPRASVSALEAGKRSVTGLELRRLARLYRRDVGWLLGDESAVTGHDALYRATSALSETDKEQVLRFAQFLAAAGNPARRVARLQPSRVQKREPRAAPDPPPEPGR